MNPRPSQHKILIHYRFRPEKPPLVPANCDSSLLSAILRVYFFRRNTLNSRTDFNNILIFVLAKVAE
jgi:hypothetical protein